MVRSSQSCLLVLRDLCAPPSCWPASPDAANGDGATTWLAWTPLSLCKLAMLLPSSSVMVVSAMLGGLAVDSVLPALMPLVTPLICWISYVICSVLSAARTFVVAVGRRASTVKVQSSWFCSKRRRRLQKGFR